MAFTETTILVRWTNHDYFSQDCFADLATALTYAKSKGFEATFYSGPAGRNPYKVAGTLIGSWSIIGGFRAYGEGR